MWYVLMYTYICMYTCFYVIIACYYVHVETSNVDIIITCRLALFIFPLH